MSSYPGNCAIQSRSKEGCQSTVPGLAPSDLSSSCTPVAFHMALHCGNSAANPPFIDLTVCRGRRDPFSSCIAPRRLIVPLYCIAVLSFGAPEIYVDRASSNEHIEPRIGVDLGLLGKLFIAKINPFVLIPTTMNVQYMRASDQSGSRLKLARGSKH